MWGLVRCLEGCLLSGSDWVVSLLLLFVDGFFFCFFVAFCRLVLYFRKFEFIAFVLCFGFVFVFVFFGIR